jgi:uncharacterized protein (DUF2336 family)
MGVEPEKLAVQGAHQHRVHRTQCRPDATTTAFLSQSQAHQRADMELYQDIYMALLADNSGRSQLQAHLYL